jgi:chitin disaccharide deacetylase
VIKRVVKKLGVRSLAMLRLSGSLIERLGFSGQSVVVIVNIDDVGLHRDITEASFGALNFGMVKSGSIMVPCPNFDYAAQVWKQHAEYDLGIHLTLTCEWGARYPWTPILSRNDVPSLYDGAGRMWSTDQAFIAHAKGLDIRKELEAQIKTVFDMGLNPSHLDHHMNIYRHPEFIPIVLDLSRKYGLAVYVPRRRRYKVPFVKNNLRSLRRQGYVFGDSEVGTYKMAAEDVSGDFVRQRYYSYLRSLKPGVHIFKVHIGFQTREILEICGERDSGIRQVDYDVWTSNETKSVAEELGITFMGYRPLQRLQTESMGKSSGKHLY